MTSGYKVPGGNAREQLGALIVRHEAVAWLGVADRDKAGSVGGQCFELRRRVHPLQRG